MTLSPYKDPTYRAARAWLTAHPDTPCWRCGRPADTIDHVPAVAEHTHRRDARCCDLKPACTPCNMGAGGQLRHRLAEPHTPW